jgi:nicotinamide phosphoribosyltransferase
MHKTDFYKVDHRRQYPPGTEVVFSNWTPRRSRMENVDKVVFFGLQAYLFKMQREWHESFFSQPREIVVIKYKERIQHALPDCDITFQHVEDLHDLGYLPLEIWALKEGVSVPIGVPMFVMWNTHPEFFWITNYLETSMSANLWGPCTAATIAKEYRKVLDYFAELTGGDPEFVPFQGHDFSYRGMYGDDAAAMSGAGHLLSFMGTDTIPAIDFLEEYYGAPAKDIGGSVAATEHSVMCMGTKESEIETYRRLITEVYPTGIVSIVSDTWDYWNVWTKILPALKDDIMTRDGKVVIRPDSGDPVRILTGDDDAEFGSPANRGSFELAWDLFGGTRTSKGYRQLDPHIGLIYGDSITLDRCKEICARLVMRKFVPNMVLGIGSYTYQMVTRDTFGFALKSTAGIVNGEIREIFKDPKTDSGEKKSAKGLITVDSNLKLKNVKTFDEIRSSGLIRVFLNGVINPHNSLRTLRGNVIE